MAPKNKSENSYPNPKFDLIEDRAIESAELDHFGHQQFAEQAAITIEAIRTPANIAIYAPWGSGKSSLSNLLGQQFDNKYTGFVYFDAFKYAEAPLRREFIRQVAHKLGIDEKKFNQGMYEEENDNSFKIDGTTIQNLVRNVALILGAFLLALLFLAMILAWSSGKKFWPAWGGQVENLLPNIFGAGVIIVPLFGLIQAQLTINKKRFAPESHEQFENLFRELILKAKKKNSDWNRIVIFIDELDRCSASEVASTLETLKTFLEVDSCIFIVAADRSVLETAVVKESRQETPFNLQNPYYSAGSSYLDKIFQYQWQLPPLVPSGLSRFAIDLVRKKASGLWNSINAEEVISVLIPLHIQSPRRVKELLNAYVMTYRITERRIADGRIDGDIQTRATELAKLVCLQLEFPVFAADLANEPRLPELVLAYLENAEMNPPVGVASDVWNRVKAYASGRVQLDVILTSMESAGDSEPAQKVSMINAQGQLLIRYLQRTKRITGPSSDLIYLEGTGYAFDLPTSLASRMKRMASDHDVDGICVEMEKLPEAEQIAVIRLLGSHIKEAQIGIEGSNSISSLLGAVGAFPSLNLDVCSDEIADELNSTIDFQVLEVRDLKGALILALSTRRYIGNQLVDFILTRDEAIKETDLASIIAFSAEKFDRGFLDRVAVTIANLIARLGWENAFESITSWSDERAIILLKEIEKAIANIFKETDEQASVSGVPLTDQTNPRIFSVNQLRLVLQKLSESDRVQVITQLIVLVLSINNAEARTLAFENLSRIAPVKSRQVIELVTKAVNLRSISERADWLNAIDKDFFQQEFNSVDVLTSCIESWLKKEDFTTPKDDSKIPMFESLAESLFRLMPLNRDPQVIKFETLEIHGSFTSLTGPQITKLKVNLAFGLSLERAGFVLDQIWKTSFIEAGITLTGLSAPDTLLLSAIKDYLDFLILALSGDFTETQIEQLSNGITNCPSLTINQRLFLKAILSTTLSQKFQSNFDPLPLDEIMSVLSANPANLSDADVSKGIGIWFGESNPPVTSAVQVLEQFVDLPMPEEIRVGVRKYSDKLSSDDQIDVIRQVLASFPSMVPSEEFFEAIRFYEGDLVRKLELIISLFKNSSNEIEYRAIFRLVRALRLSDKKLIKFAFEEIFRKIIVMNSSGREIAIENLDLLQSLPVSDRANFSRELKSHSNIDEWEVYKVKLIETGFIK